jgi:hypothetical protein
VDTVIATGTHAVDGRGLPVAVTGVRERLQRALIRLAVPKGRFALDTALGSELHRLAGCPPQNRDRTALAYVQEALAPIRELRVLGASCQMRDEQSLLVQVELADSGGEKIYTLEVTSHG